MSDPNPTTPPRPPERLTRAARLRLAASLFALGAGAAAVVIAALLLRATLS